MREIKFRGQTRRKGERIINMAGDKCESNWVYGGIFPQNEDEKGFAIIYQQEPEIRKYPVYADTVGQYIGFADLRQKEAFEHDIVFYEDGGCYGHILFESGRFLIKWEESRPDLRNDIDFWFTQRRIYIVGNIFDNPELLKGDEA